MRYLQYERHGMSGTSEYRAWVEMIRRCTDEEYQGYKWYGGRGIKVCEKWSHSFSAFYKDIGPKTSINLTLERIDNNKNYEPGNVRWATWEEQVKNKRPRVDHIARLSREEVNKKIREKIRYLNKQTRELLNESRKQNRKNKMAVMTKIHVALTPDQVRELTMIEEDTDRPRTRLVRRAIVDYLKKYRADNPGFAERVGVPLEIERELKPGLKTDIVVMRGVKHEVVILPDGSWRLPTADDYIEEGSSSASSIIDAQ